MAISQINTNSIASGAVSAGDLASTLDLTGKTVTLPAGTTNAGKVLQIVQGTTSTSTSTTSTSYVATTLEATITPSSASNKVLCIWSGHVGSDSSSDGRRPVCEVFINGSGTSQNITGRVVANYALPIGNQYLHSPSSTSALTFKVYMRSISGANVIFMQEGQTAVITLMEIAG